MIVKTEINGKTHRHQMPEGFSQYSYLPILKNKHPKIYSGLIKTNPMLDAIEKKLQEREVENAAVN